MMFDVMVKEGDNEKGKQIVQVYRIHYCKLNGYLRELQVYGKFIIGVIPIVPYTMNKENYSKVGLSKEKLEEVRGQVDPVDTESVDDYEGF